MAGGLIFGATGIAGRAPSFYNGFGAKFGRKSTRDPVSSRRPRDPAGVPKSRGPGGAAAGFGPAAPRRRAPPPPAAGAPRRRRAPPPAGHAAGGRHMIYYNIISDDMILHNTVIYYYVILCNLIQCFLNIICQIYVCARPPYFRISICYYKILLLYAKSLLGPRGNRKLLYMD